MLRMVSPSGGNAADFSTFFWISILLMMKCVIFKRKFVIYTSVRLLPGLLSTGLPRKERSNFFIDKHTELLRVKQRHPVVCMSHLIIFRVASCASYDPGPRTMKGFKHRRCIRHAATLLGLARRSWAASVGRLQGQFGFSEHSPRCFGLCALPDVPWAVPLGHLLGGSGRTFPGRAAWCLLARCTGVNGVPSKFVSTRACESDLIWK